MGGTDAILLMAGEGKRLHGPLKKQFLPDKNGDALFLSALKVLYAYPFDRIVLVVPKGDLDLTKNLCKGLFDERRILLTEGSDSREGSAYCGLLTVKEFASDHVLIHDADRPFLSAALLERILSVKNAEEGIVPVLSVHDSVLSLEGGTRYVERKSLRRVQTPQLFPYRKLLAAFEKEEGDLPSFTDEGSIYLAAGERIRTVEGEERNIKITTNEDYERWVK